jgi:hypothetical protein
MAQDFHQAFGLNGPDETHINIGDEAGVALAALKGLNEKEKTLAKELREQSSELRAKDAQIHELMRRIERLESKLSDKD